MTAGAAPPGYEPVTAPHAHAMAARDVAPALRRALAGGETLHQWASQQPNARRFEGRAPSYALPLGPEAAVVRHSRHGGLLAPITGDLFRWPTRAPSELAIAQRLTDAGVPTPTVLAYVLYPARLGFARADVVTREVPGSDDLWAVLARVSSEERRAWVLPAVARLLDALQRAGAEHPDLNVKNVLLTREADGAGRAWVLDTDVVKFGRAGDAGVAARNRARLSRSLEKRARAFRTPLSASEVAALSGTAVRFDT